MKLVPTTKTHHATPSTHTFVDVFGRIDKYSFVLYLSCVRFRAIGSKPQSRRQIQKQNPIRLLCRKFQFPSRERQTERREMFVGISLRLTFVARVLRFLLRKGQVFFEVLVRR